MSIRITGPRSCGRRSPSRPDMRMAFNLPDQACGYIFPEGPGQANPIRVPNTVMNAPAGHASIELGFRGVNTTVNHQAISAETAIAYAAMEIRRGTADVMLAGGDLNPLITSLKGATGEIFASGGIGAAALALSVREGVVPPTVGLKRPLCSLPFVVGEARCRPVKKAILSGISFGGTYACLVFERDKTESPAIKSP